ncbi:uncharacterized protein LOC144451100 isoform X2 [Glandiceps talaboti]
MENPSNLTTNSSGNNILSQNCRAEWPISVCTFANICGLISTAIWFIVLFPQLVKNWRRKSVVGLSILWATANFTASLINLFFVFRVVQLPLYIKISAVYMPTLEILLLIQFCVYGTDYSSKAKWIYLAICLLVWAVIIMVQLITDIYGLFQWGAIILWSIETFPQVILNMQRQSTSGQATKSVYLTLVGKTTDFLSNYLLVVPIQYVIMIYFSSTMGYFNGIQLFWYWKKRDQVSTTPLTSGANTGERVQDVPDMSKGEYMYFTNDDEAVPIPDVTTQLDDEDNSSSNNEAVPISRIHQLAALLCSLPVRFSLIITLAAIMVGFIVALIWNTTGYIAILAPTGIGVVLATSIVYRKKVKGY